jgi:hypothetical protein
MPSWKVLYVQGRCEFKVEQQLARLGIEHYLPKVQVMRKWSDRMKKLTVPAFPSYLFVCNEDKDRHAVFQAKGVLHYVRRENRDAILREEELAVTPEGRVHDPSGFPAEPKRLKRKAGQNQSRYIGREYRNTGGAHRQKIRSVKTRKSIHGLFGRNT